MARAPQGGVKLSERHVIEWDVHIERDYMPYYTVKMARYDRDPIPPVRVHISAVFDDNNSAEAFEHTVRELLKAME